MKAKTKEEFRRLLLEAVSRHNVLPLTSSCNLSCLFCSHRRISPELYIHTFTPLAETQLLELIPFLDAENKIIIGESSTRLCEGEPFTHPSILSLLFSLRERFPKTPLQLTTNGTLLDQKTVKALQKLAGETPRGEPLLELVISLNCSDAAARREILGDREPQRVIAALQLCQKMDIPFHGSVVAAPHLTGWDDLEQSLLLLEAMGARTIRLFLPGITRFAPELLQWDESLWSDIADFRRRLQARMSCPLMLEPPLKKDLRARVEGIIRGTAAARSGLRAGDRIDAVDGEKVCSGVDAFERIKKAACPILSVERPAGASACGSVPLQIVLQKEKGVSPGLVMDYDLAEETMAAVRQEIDRRSAALPLLLTSRAAAPLWECAAASGLIPPLTRIEAVPNRFFGGTICCAGLLTVSDLREKLGVVPQGNKPDLLLIPAAPFDQRGRDLRGESYRELFHAFPGLTIAVLS